MHPFFSSLCLVTRVAFLGSEPPIWDTLFVLEDPHAFLGVTCRSGILYLCLVTREAFSGDDLPIWDTLFCAW
jgi:hypothetical protein